MSSIEIHFSRRLTTDEERRARGPGLVDTFSSVFAIWFENNPAEAAELIKKTCVEAEHDLVQRHGFDPQHVQEIFDAALKRAREILGEGQN